MIRDGRSTWTWMPVIIGIALGAVVAAAADAWWWVAVGAVAGGALAAWQAGRPRSSSPHGH